MATHMDVTNGPALLLLKYWQALKSAIWALSSTLPAHAFAESEVLVEVAEDLLDTAYSLRTIARDLLQEQLPLGAPAAPPPAQKELSAFQERFPDVPEERAPDVIVAYQLIVTIAPSLVAFPEILYAQIRVQLDLGNLGLDRALALIELERQLCPPDRRGSS